MQKRHLIKYLLPLLLKKYPVHLCFFITSRCNANCSFCFYNTNTSKRQLSLKEIDLFSKRLPSLLWLAFSGGEVFLRDDIVDITEIMYRNTRPSIILYSTNGLLPDTIRNRLEQIVQTCNDSTIVVKVSLDGIGEEHDRIRGHKGAFQKVLKTLELLKDLLKYNNFELGINTVLYEGNMHFIEDIIEYVNGMDFIRTHTVSLVRSPSPHSPDLVKTYQRVSFRLEQALKHRSTGVYRFSGGLLKAAQDILQRRLILKTLHQQRAVIPCTAGRTSVVLTEDGTLYPCESFKHRLGNIRDHDYSIERILRSHKELLIKELSAGCYCTHECNMMLNIFSYILCYPALLKQYLTLRLTGMLHRAPVKDTSCKYQSHKTLQSGDSRLNIMDGSDTNKSLQKV